MQGWPVARRGYILALYLGALAAIALSIRLLLMSKHVHGAVLQNAVLLTLLAYIGERITLQVGGYSAWSLANTVYIAAILLLPTPVPIVVALVAPLLVQALHARTPLAERAIALCVPVLVVSLSSYLLSYTTRLTGTLHLSAGLASLSSVIMLVCLYYTLASGAAVGVPAARPASTERQGWLQSRRIVWPQLVTTIIGIPAALAWQHDPLAPVLFIVPLTSVWVAFRATARAQDHAQSLRERSTRLKAVLAAGRHLRLQHGQVDLMQYAAEAMHGMVGATTVTAYLYDVEDATLLKRVVTVPTDASTSGPARLLVPPPERGIYATDDGRQVVVPLSLEDDSIVGLLLVDELPTSLAADVLDAIHILATQAAVALENARLHEQAVAQAAEDGLTGLLNHRSFQMRLDEEVARAQPNWRPLTLMMIDLDDFGVINNTYGHQHGDATLIAVATALHRSVRAADVVARYGGDEFAVILPETDLEEALAIAERVRGAIGGLAVLAHGLSIHINTSVGVAAFPTHARTREELVRAADQAAYAAKHAGKGCVSRPENAVLALDADPAALALQLQHANMATVEALAAAVDAKDPYTRGHSQRVSTYAAAIAQVMNLSEEDVARVRLAGLLHDVGKIGVPDAILTKPGELSDTEFAILQQHPLIGERMLAAVPFLREILPAVRHHHERWDGCGYPDRRTGKLIPLDAAILAVADSFDAMTSSRPYRPALPVSEARRRIREGSDLHYDTRVVTAFERGIAEGILVPQSSGQTVLLDRKRVNDQRDWTTSRGARAETPVATAG